MEVIDWLDRLSAQLAKTRDATRERVTAVADDLAEELLTVKAELAAAHAHIAALLEENDHGASWWLFGSWTSRMETSARLI
ncbi:hypothetical protein [Hydrogenophaga sp. OTU3427]|uniref:hypothetical protein n=1 Tax=Hydrogenophaga sp. OTU3427 TaxID=3043856 RepID=UPI00313B7799